MKNFVSILSITSFLLLLWQCNPMFERKDEAKTDLKAVQVDLASEKEDLAEDLRDCSDRIGRRLSAISEQMEDANSEKKKSLKELQARLVKEKTKVDNSLKKVEKSGNESWVKVKEQSKTILTEAKIEAQRTEELVENLLQ